VPAWVLAVRQNNGLKMVECGLMIKWLKSVTGYTRVRIFGLMDVW
jgi:hypothetical protein